MASFWKLKKLSRFTAARRLKEIIPELKYTNTFEIKDALSESDIIFIEENKKPVKLLTRLTFPFALVVLILLLVTMPLKFMITGSWRYKSVRLHNWFTALGFY